MPPEVPLVDRELELDTLGVAYIASRRLDLAPDDERARHALEVVRDLDPLLVGCRDARAVLLATQAVIREHGAAAPALVRDRLRRERALDELRFVLPQVVGGAAGVLAAIDGYHERLLALAKRRADYLAGIAQAADALVEL